jgi:PAS domain S-box-containing protein
MVPEFPPVGSSPRNIAQGHGAIWCAYGASLIALVVMVGWYMRSPALIKFVPGGSAMKFNAALGYALLAGALAVRASVRSGSPLRSRSLLEVAPTVVALVVTAYAAVSLGADFLGQALASDQWIVRDWSESAESSLRAGRMSRLSALVLALLGVGLIFGKAVRRPCSVVAAFVASLNLVEVILGAIFASAAVGLTRMSVPSSLACLALAAGLYLLDSDFKPWTAIRPLSRVPAMTTAPFVIFGSVLLLTACVILGVNLDWDPDSVIRAGAFFTVVAAFALVIWLKVLASHLMKVEAERQSYVLSIRQQNEQLTQAVAERTRELEAKSEEHLLHALVARYTSDVVVITDVAGEIVWVNQAFESLTGYSLAEVKGRKPGSFLQGPGTDPKTVAQISAAVRSNRAFACDILNYTRTGQPYWLSIDAQPVRDEAGRLVYFVAVERDVTLRRKLEEDLERARKRSQYLIDSVDGAVFELAIGGANTRRFTFIGPGIESLTGCSSAEISRDSDIFWGRVDPRDAAAVETSLVASLAAEKPWHCSFRMPTPDGAVGWLDVRATPQRGPRGEITLVGVFVNSTHLHDARERERASLLELERWFEVMRGREERLLGLKAEVNELLVARGEPPRYEQPERLEPSRSPRANA